MIETTGDSAQPSDSRVVVTMTALAVLLGAAWAGRRLARTYYYFDEWSMIGRVTQLGPVDGATTSFNGHLWFFQDTIFRVQARWFGLDSNGFLVGMFLASLVALHLSLAGLVRRIGVPLTPALLLGGLLTYLGPAAQNFVFAVQVSPTFALAAAAGATTIVLNGAPTRRRSSAVAALLTMSFLFDSGVALLALALCGGTVLGLWPRRRWWVLAPCAVLTIPWYVFADLGPRFDSSVGERLAFACRLVVRGAGSVVGGEALAGGLVLVTCAAAVAVAAAAGRLDRTGWTVTLSAGVATLMNVAGIAQSRAGLPGFSFFENNRYLQNVAIPLTVTFLPAIVACAGLTLERWRVDDGTRSVIARLAPVIVVASCFVLGLDEERDYADVFIERTERVDAGIADIGTVLRAGCPSGRPPDLDARALGDLSPQVTGRLVGDLVARGFLTVEAAAIDEVDPAILADVCPH